jgi:hypothetical protein
VPDTCISICFCCVLGASAERCEARDQSPSRNHYLERDEPLHLFVVVRIALGATARWRIIKRIIIICAPFYG